MTRVQPEGPASKVLQPGDKIIQVFCCLYKIPELFCDLVILSTLTKNPTCLLSQANGYSFVNIDHGNAVSLLKTFPNTVDLIIIRDMQA